MSHRINSAIGHLVHEYVRAKWHRPGVTLSAEELGRRLDPQLRERIDLLGADDERLLEVAQNEVLGRIEVLEREAVLEDLGASNDLARVRACEEDRMKSRGVIGGSRPGHGVASRKSKRHFRQGAK